METIKIDHVSKKLKDTVVLSDINLELKGKHTYGIVGKNGSGKTMLFRTIAGLLRPTEGRILADGSELYKNQYYIQNLGLVLENIGLYPDLSAADNLRYLAKMNGRIGNAEILAVLERVGLDAKNRRKIKTYSLGMRQKLMLAQAIMEKPEVLLLDEPMNGLDAESVEKMRQMIQEEKARGAIVFLASHNAEDIRVLCDEVFFMEHGVVHPEERKAK